MRIRRRSRRAFPACWPIAMDSRAPCAHASGAAHDETNPGWIGRAGPDSVASARSTWRLRWRCARPAARDAGLRPLALDGAVPGERGARRHRPAPGADEAIQTTAARHGQRRDRVGLGRMTNPAGRHAPLWWRRVPNATAAGSSTSSPTCPPGGLARYFVVSARIAGAPADANGARVPRGRQDAGASRAASSAWSMITASRRAGWC